MIDTLRLTAEEAKRLLEAREISGVDCLIAGSLGPLAGGIDIDEPEGRPAIAAAHAEQAALLAGRGADLLVLETFFRLDELVLAVEAARGVTDLPLVACLTFPFERIPESHPECAQQVRPLFDHEVLAAGAAAAARMGALLRDLVARS